MLMNIHNKLWNFLLDLIIGLIFICHVRYGLKEGTFILILVTIVLIALCSMIVVFANSKMFIPKRYIEFDGFCKLLKFGIVIYVFQSNNTKLDIAIFILGLTLALVDYLNRKKIYKLHPANMYIDLYCDEIDIEKKKKQSYKLAWMMFLGVIFTFLLNGSNTMLILLIVSIIILYESILSILLFLELKVLNISTKRIALCFIFFYLILVITSILNILGYNGIFIYLILGGAIVPILNTLKEVHINN